MGEIWDAFQAALNPGKIGSGPASRFLLRMELYGPLLSAGLYPHQIERILDDPVDAMRVAQEALRSAAVSSADANRQVEELANTAGDAVIETVGRVAGPDTGVGLGVGLVLAGISLGNRAAEGCASGVTMAALTGRGKLRDAVSYLRGTLHDGMDFTRDGRPKPLGTKAGTGDVRARKVKHVIDWLSNAVEKAGNTTLLTLWGQVRCMEEVLRALGANDRVAMAGKYYASYVGQMQALVEMIRIYGFGRFADLHFPSVRYIVTADPWNPGVAGRERAPTLYKQRTLLNQRESWYRSIAAHGEPLPDPESTLSFAYYDFFYPEMASTAPVAPYPDSLVFLCKDTAERLAREKPDYHRYFRWRRTAPQLTLMRVPQFNVTPAPPPRPRRTAPPPPRPRGTAPPPPPRPRTSPAATAVGVVGGGLLLGLLAKKLLRP